MWTGSSLSTPLAADFVPGPEGAAEGCTALAGICLSIFHSLASRREAKLCSVTSPNTI